MKINLEEPKRFLLCVPIVPKVFLVWTEAVCYSCPLNATYSLPFSYILDSLPFSLLRSSLGVARNTFTRVKICPSVTILSDRLFVHPSLFRPSDHHSYIRPTARPSIRCSARPTARQSIRPSLFLYHHWQHHRCITANHQLINEPHATIK